MLIRSNQASSPDALLEKTLATLPTPCLIVDHSKMMRNGDRLRKLFKDSPVRIRPHLKTIKSIEAAQVSLETTTGPATVSTLLEAEYFGSYGVTDILYSVSVTPHKLEKVSEIRQSGVDLMVVADSLNAARFLASHARATNDSLPVLLEIDVDGHRSGVKIDESDVLVEIGKTLVEGGCDLRGVMAHAGESYGCENQRELVSAAENERSGAVSMANALRSAGLPSPIVSIGSTPTAFSMPSYSGITEVRAGVYIFFDLFQLGIGVCSIDEIALSVLATVVGHNRANGWIIVDAGWMALSLDRGTATQPIDQYYGVVCDLNGRPIDDLVVARVNQEHGTIAIRPGSCATLPLLEIGDRVRILPNHACATASQHDRYFVLESDKIVRKEWPRIGGW